VSKNKLHIINESPDYAGPVWFCNDRRLNATSAQRYTPEQVGARLIIAQLYLYRFYFSIYYFTHLKYCN